jgi:hypothetical protein
LRQCFLFDVLWVLLVAVSSRLQELRRKFASDGTRHLNVYGRQFRTTHHSLRWVL